MKIRATLALTFLLICSLFLTGCGAEDVGITLGSTWSKTEGATYEYALSFTPGESTCGYSFSLTEGKFVTKITPIDDNAENKELYRYETKLTVSGTYQKGEETLPFTDVTTTSTLLHGINTYSLFPVESEKVMKQHSVYPVKGGAGYEIRTYDFRVKTAYDYNKEKAAVFFHTYNPETNMYDLPVEGIPENRTYTGLKDASFFDNDALLFTFRAFPLKPGFSTSFTTLDAVNAKKTKMFFSAAKELTARTYTLNGTETALDVLKCTARIDAGTSSGKPYTMYYAPMEGQTARNILTELTTYLPYGMGTLTYSLTSF